jgi:hypothetical protein
MDTWMELLGGMGVFTEHRMEKCHACKKDEGTVQMWGMNRHGEKYPLYKLCASCLVDFKKPSARMEKRRKRGIRSV